jgi:hypothetical protein
MLQSRQAIHREIQGSQDFKRFGKSVGVSLTSSKGMASAKKS